MGGKLFPTGARGILPLSILAHESTIRCKRGLVQDVINAVTYIVEVSVPLAPRIAELVPRMRSAVRDSSVLDPYAKPALARMSLRRIRGTKCPSTSAEGNPYAQENT